MQRGTDNIKQHDSGLYDCIQALTRTLSCSCVSLKSDYVSKLEKKLMRGKKEYI